jgi:hypothetical protein
VRIFNNICVCVLIAGHDDNVVDLANEEDDDDDDDDEDDDDDDDNGEVGLEYLQKPGEELEVTYTKMKTREPLHALMNITKDHCQPF